MPALPAPEAFHARWKGAGIGSVVLATDAAGVEEGGCFRIDRIDLRLRILLAGLGVHLPRHFEFHGGSDIQATGIWATV